MKQALKKFSVLSLGLALLAPVSLLAQKEDKDAKEKKEVEQVIITRKGNTDQKVVIEINGDKVTVNGKEVDKKDGDVSVTRTRVKDVRALAGGINNRFTWNNDEGDNITRFFNGTEDYAMLGVTTDKANEGAEVQSVTKKSAAEKAGLKKGDIITKIDNVKISDADDLSKEIKKHKAGDKVTVTYLRDKKENKVSAELTKWNSVNVYGYGLNSNQDFKVDLGDMDFYKSMPRIQTVPGRQSQSFGGITAWNSSAPRLGLSVQDTDDGKGVKVIDVDDESNAAKAGLKEDDVITEIDGKAVNGADEVAKIIKESKDKISVKVKLLRDGKTENVEVRIPRKLKTANL